MNVLDIRNAFHVARYKALANSPRYQYTLGLSFYLHPETHKEWSAEILRQADKPPDLDLVTTFYGHSIKQDETLPKDTVICKPNKLV